MQLWGWPIALAALSLFGLFAALLGQTVFWWALSWVALAAPVGVVLYRLLHPGPRTGV
jgi:hypothetical protein